MGSAAAKVLTGIGALILLGAGGCFLFVGEAFRGGGSLDPTLLTIIITLFVAGVLCAVAFLGLVREKER